MSEKLTINEALESFTYAERLQLKEFAINTLKWYGRIDSYWWTRIAPLFGYDQVYAHMKYGLCGLWLNYLLPVEALDVYKTGLMSRLLDLTGNDAIYPFNKNTANSHDIKMELGFESGYTDFKRESENNACHLNANRLKFLHELANAEVCENGIQPLHTGAA